mgnify:FL=1
MEGKDLIICDKHITSSSPFGRRLDLVLDGEVVSRVHWNYGATFDGEAHHGRARRYVKLAGLSVASSPLGLYDPTPGLFTDEQTRNEFSAVPTRKETRQKKKDDKTDAKRNARKERLRLTDGEAAAIAAASAAVRREKVLLRTPSWWHGSQPSGAGRAGWNGFFPGLRRLSAVQTKKNFRIVQKGVEITDLFCYHI